MKIVGAGPFVRSHSAEPGDGVAIRVGAGDNDDGGLGQAHLAGRGGPIDPAIHCVRQGWVTPCICGFGGRAASVFRRADATWCNLGMRVERSLGRE